LSEDLLVLLIIAAIGVFWLERKLTRGRKRRNKHRSKRYENSHDSVVHFPRWRSEAYSQPITRTPPTLSPQLQAPPVPAAQVIQGHAYVVDGDSLRIQKTQIRLFGVDAPELDHPHGKNAKWALHNLCKGHLVRAEVINADTHGRTVARCTLPDGRDLSAEMVKQGLAIDWPKFSDGEYRELEVPNARKKMWLADARQKGRMQVWENYKIQKRTSPPAPK